MNQIAETKAARAAHAGLYQALAAAQAQMGPALKDTVNPHFKTRYADLASVMAACIPALTANGIAVLQPPCEIDGQRYVKTILAHESGETVECAVPLIVSKNDMQGYGSAVTYARRYGLMAMAGIAPDDDDGNAAVASAPRADNRQDTKQADDRPAKAVEYLAGAKTLEVLQTRWANIPADVKADDRVVAAKDARKAELTNPAADLGGDKIPY